MRIPHPEIDAASGRRPYAATSGVLLAGTPVPFAIAAWAFGGVFTAPVWAVVTTIAAALALFVAGIGITSNVRTGRVLGSAGLIGLLALASPGLLGAPALTLVLSSALMVAIGSLWHLGAHVFVPRLRRGQPLSGRVRSAAGVALCFWLVVAMSSDQASRDASMGVGASVLVAILIGMRWLLSSRSDKGPRTRVVAIGLLATAGLAVAMRDDLWSMVSAGTIYALLVAVFGAPNEGSHDADSHWWSTLLDHPERMLVTSFATMAGIGTILLALPQSASSGSSIGGMDAGFTAVSAVCVTGLIVRDTAVELSSFGQATVLVLIQLGGLGIMTFSTAALRVLGGRMSMRRESAIARLIGTDDRSRLITSAQDVLRVTFLCEGIGAIVLSALFYANGSALGTACWHGVFTSISAFCNAGFALQTDSLVSCQREPLILHTVSLLIIIGGLSPAVVLAVGTRRQRVGPLPVQVKLCLVASALLLFFGALSYLVLEWQHSLGDLSLFDKLHNAWFQSVTLRTAGFNTVDLTAVHPASYLLMLTWMFIGACPGGTGGGVKTTTVAVLLLSVGRTIRNATDVTLFGRRIPEQTVMRAAVMVTTAILICAVALLAILVTQNIPLPVAAFEVVSALGTVGLSQGASAQLDDVGKVIIAGCMFIGRIGGLSIMMFMSHHARSQKVILPTQNLDIG